MKSIVASCLLVFIATTQAQWLNNYGYGLNAAAFTGRYYPANGLSAYTGFPARTAPFYGFAHPGYWPATNSYYPAASLASYDVVGNQVGGYGPVQDTPEVAQAKAAHFAAHAAAKAHLIQPVVTAVADVVAAPSTLVETSVEAVPVATAISRQKRQILPLGYAISPFSNGFQSPLAYNNFAAHSGYNYGAPFGYHFAQPYYNNQF